MKFKKKGESEVEDKDEMSLSLTKGPLEGVCGKGGKGINEKEETPIGQKIRRLERGTESREETPL